MLRTIELSFILTALIVPLVRAFVLLVIAPNSATITPMKILFVSTEFEEQARGITGIIKSMITAAKADGHEVGILAGYPRADLRDSELLDTKVEHLYLQHYLATGKKNIFPSSLKSRRTQLSIIARHDYMKPSEIRIQHDLISQPSNLANKLDFIVKVPYVYHFINHGLGKIAKQAIKKAVKKYDIDLVITGAPMDLTKKDVAPAKLVQFVHDTMPIDMLETPADNMTPQRFARQLYAAASNSDIIFTNSKDTTNKVHEVNPDANIHILYGTASSKADQFTDDTYLARKGLTKGNYLVFVSVVERRKNLATLFDAYIKAYPKINIPLVIVGGKGYGYKEIVAHHKDLPPEIRENIILAGFVSETDKYALLNNARAFVFPSLYEGIGLPIIEAFASGLPVLTSRRGALPEAGGDAALYVENPYDVDEVADAIVKIANDEKLRKDLQAHIKKQVAKFTQDKFTHRFKEALKELQEQ